MSVKWHSAKPLIAIVKQGKNMPKAIMNNAKILCENVKTKSRNRAPVLSGRMRRGIVVVSIRDGYMVYGMERYTVFPEAGTKWQRAKWFMKSSIEEELPKFLNMPMEKMIGLKS